MRHFDAGKSKVWLLVCCADGLCAFMYAHNVGLFNEKGAAALRLVRLLVNFAFDGFPDNASDRLAKIDGYVESIQPIVPENNPLDAAPPAAEVFANQMQPPGQPSDSETSHAASSAANGDAAQPNPSVSLLDESPATRDAKAELKIRFESLVPGYKKALKSPKGFLVRFVFAEAKNARDAGDFAAARGLLDELEELIKLAELRLDQNVKRSGERFDADHKACERKARWEGGEILKAAARHLRAARSLAAKKEFAKANRELDRAWAILDHGLNPPPPKDSGKSRPFTITFSS